MKYVGQWKNGKYEGKGSFTDGKGGKQIGIWSNGELVKDESPKPPPSKLINLVCMVDNGPSKDLEFQYSISPESNFAISLRGKQPSDVFVTKGTISFKQGDVHIQISRLTGKYSQTLDGSVMGTGNCKPTEQVKPKF